MEKGKLFITLLSFLIIFNVSVIAETITPNDDISCLIGFDSNWGPGLLVKYANWDSYIEFTLGSETAESVTLNLWADGGTLGDWGVGIYTAEFDFDEDTYQGTDPSGGWSSLIASFIVYPEGAYQVDLTNWYNTNLGKTMTLKLSTISFPANTSEGAYFEDKEGGIGTGQPGPYLDFVPAAVAPPDPATNPSPSGTNVSRDTTLSWTAGSGALTHDLYFGKTNPPALIGNQSETTYTPASSLDYDTTYYWQVDEVNSYGTTTGTLWSFTTEAAPVITMATGWWRFDETAGLVASDSSDNGNNGTLVNMDSSDWVTGQYGNALDFDGTDDYVQMPRASILEGGSQLVAEAWVKTTETGVWGTIVGTGDDGWVLAKTPSNGMTAGFWLKIGKLMIVNNSNVIITDGEWHHIVTIYDSSVPQVSLYVDGTVASTTVDFQGGAVSPGGAIANNQDNPVLIGENAYATGRYWNGLIDEVKIYNNADEYIYHLNNPDEAWGPTPSDGQSGVEVDSILSWVSGDSVISHDVYFGTSESAVANAHRLAGDVNGDGTVNTEDLVVLASQWLTDPGAIHPSADVAFSGTVNIEDFAVVASDWGLDAASEFQGNQSYNIFDPGALTQGVTYYWRIDEVNPSQPDSPWAGRVWSFTATSPTSGGDIVFPGASWQTKTPAELGLDGTKLDQFAANVGGVGCIVRQGYMVKTWGDQSSKDWWASAVKPVISTMLCYAVEEGLLTDVHELISDHGWNMDSHPEDRDNMEFYHLANMTSGYARGEAPGAAWAYNDYAIKLYAETLFGNVYGTAANTAATNVNRLGALGFEDGSIFQVNAGYGEQLNTTPRDFARIGWFWLNRGYWNGQQLLPRHYFDDYMKVLVPSSLPRTTSSDSDYLGIGTYGGGSDQTPYGPGLYGFNWWFNENQNHWPDVPADAFQANGHWGREVVTVIPSLSLVVAWRMSAWPDSSYFQPGSASSPMNTNLKLLVDGCPPVPQAIPGALVHDDEHPAWLKRYDGNYLYMCGPGDPEDFLYRGTHNTDGTRTGDQMDLINKLAGTGANCIYFQAVKTNGGDNNGDPYMNPFVDGNVNGLIDEDILNQWEGWFDAMDDNGIVIFFMFYDDWSNPFGGGDTMPAQETYMIDTIVNKFKHHKNLIWIVSEEYNKVLSETRVSNIAARIKLDDEYNHPVGTHQLPSTSFNFNGDDNMDEFAMQLNNPDTSYVHQACLDAWNNVGGQKNVNLAEIYDFTTNPITGIPLRQKAWAAAMGGAYSMWLWMDIASTPVSDLEICGRVVTFMESTKFYMTQPYDSLARGTTDYVLADPGNVYIVYSDSAGTELGVNVEAGNYLVKWYDPIDGDWSDEGIQTLTTGDQTFTRPTNISSTEAVLYLEAQVPTGRQTLNESTTGRRYILYVPTDYDPAVAYPLVISSHGTSQDGDTEMDSTGPNSGWDQGTPTWPELVDGGNDVIVACPDMNGAYGEAGCAISSTHATELAGDEAAIMAIITEIEGTYNIDTSEIMLTGFSGGGNVVHYVGLRHPDLFKGICSRHGNFHTDLVPGTLPNGVEDMPVFIFTREQDITCGNSEAISWYQSAGFNYLDTELYPAIDGWVNWYDNHVTDRHYALEWFLGLTINEEILPNDDCTTLYGENKDNDAGGEFGLFVKYADIYSWIEFTLGSNAVNQAILTLQQDDGDVPSLWTITVKGAEYNFDETTFTGVDTSGWTDVGSIPNVSGLGPVTLDMTTFYNNNLGKTITLRLYRADPQPSGNGPIFQDKELTRQFWWSANEGPKISITR